MNVPEKALMEIRQLVADRLGLDYPAAKLAELERAIIRTAEILGLDPFSEYLPSSFTGESSGREGIKRLGEFLTVGETYFFREINGLHFFQKTILPEIIGRKKTGTKEINIWSAGCCTGEEPFTIAILLNESGLDLHDWKINLVATDINKNFLEKARKGIYTHWSFRETPPQIKQLYFRQVGQNWEILPKVKSMVSFSWLNLADIQNLSAIGAMQKADVIFCRNVLMYFTPQLIHQTAAFFYDFLNEPGWFITSQVELNDQYFGMFMPVSCGNCQVYQKYRSVPVTAAKSLSDEKSRTKITLPKSNAIAAGLKPIKKNDADAKKPAMPEPVAEILYETGQYRACADLCLAKIKSGVANERQFALLIRSLGNLGELKAAKTACEQLIAKNPGIANSYYLYATILMESGDQEGSIMALRKVIYLEPDHLMGHFNLFTMLKKNGEHKLAEIHRKNVFMLIKNMNDNEPVQGAEGLTAGSIRQITGTVK
jgi:chemotaxis protein methyltransferase CheR